jgi:hypothetical protein
MLGEASLLSACSRGSDPQGYEAVAERTRRTGPFVDTAGAALSHELVRYATLAPSSHNTQCWKFALEDQAITILPDRLRQVALGRSRPLLRAFRAAGHGTRHPQCLFEPAGRSPGGAESVRRGARIDWPAPRPGGAIGSWTNNAIVPAPTGSGRAGLTTGNPEEVTVCTVLVRRDAETSDIAALESAVGLLTQRGARVLSTRRSLSDS